MTVTTLEVDHVTETCFIPLKPQQLVNEQRETGSQCVAVDTYVIAAVNVLSRDFLRFSFTLKVIKAKKKKKAELTVQKLLG